MRKSRTSSGNTVHIAEDKRGCTVYSTEGCCVKIQYRGVLWERQGCGGSIEAIHTAVANTGVYSIQCKRYCGTEGAVLAP